MLKTYNVVFQNRYHRVFNQPVIAESHPDAIKLGFRIRDAVEELSEHRVRHISAKRTRNMDTNFEAVIASMSLFDFSTGEVCHEQ